MSWEEEIRIDPKVQGGKPVIRGTRVPVEVLVRAIAAGDEVAEAAAAYRVSEAQVRAALGYAAHVVASEHAILLAGE